MLKAASEREQPYQEFPASANTHLARLSSKNFPSIKLSTAHEFSDRPSSAQLKTFLSRSSSVQLSKIFHQPSSAQLKNFLSRSSSAQFSKISHRPT